MKLAVPFSQYRHNLNIYYATNYLRFEEIFHIKLNKEVLINMGQETLRVREFVAYA